MQNSNLRDLKLWKNKYPFMRRQDHCKTNPGVLLRIEGDGKHPIVMIAAKAHYQYICMKRSMVISVSPPPHNIYHEKLYDLVKEIDNNLSNGKAFFFFAIDRSL